MGTWVPAFGSMRAIHSNIGGEFSNWSLEEVAPELGIDTLILPQQPHILQTKMASMSTLL